ncbi:5'-3' exoribonuclease 1 isoform X1 [Nasonia vitripennis]|uniref:5'-3' exoribonuclease 2 n=1 Tax=Nasonia vitripennis TaxID=7425 RepID=A0A7M7IUX8_NASVI|nr:5'-3' exoribonuclease 1 isoform X1 [Nasonia vitripennis]
MGVPKFFRYISERYPCLSEKLKEYQIPEFDNLYLDMNGIIHNCSHPNDADATFRITEETIFKNIFHYIEILFRIIQPQKLFFMAVDGVAPRAKINQQRGRRFRAAKEAEVLEAKARAKGQEIPKEARFDSNCITPGTVFMSKLNEQLKYFITYKISTDKLWQKCKIILSGSEVPGEGEHKIMDYIRYMKAQPDYEGNTRHCLYGLDADLIMLGLCSHEPHFSLLREEVKFGKTQKKILTPEETNFCLLHLSLMREYLEHEFSPVKDKLTFKFDIEKIIDDWVLMGFLVGNDFIPHLPNLHIENGALPLLYNAYMDVLPTLDGYINEAGTLNLERFEKFMEKLGKYDLEQFDEIYADLKFFEAKTGRRLNESERNSKNSPDENASPKKTNKALNALIMATENELGADSDEDLEGESDSDTEMQLEFVQHKRDYYMNKMEYANVDAETMRSQAEGYIRAIQWNLHYYYNGCCSWSWYYPHHYAPFISDIKNFKDLKLEFDLGEPFKPFEQLLAVLPAASKSLLPTAYHGLMTEEKSPIIKYYPLDFKTDLNGKKQEWEAVVLIPLIDEKSLLKAMKPCNAKLTPEERKRNSHGPMSIFTFIEKEQGIYEAPEYFPSIRSYAQMMLVNRDDILVPLERLVKGLCKGVQLSVYYPGFPTLQHIPHTACLAKAKVKVFEQPSRRENMILTVLPKELPPIDDLARKWLGKTVFIAWPHLVEALVVEVANSKTKISITYPQPKHATDGNHNFNTESMNDMLLSTFNVQRKSITENYKTRLGIDVGNIEILIHAAPIMGRQYVYSAQGKMTLEKQWSDVPQAYAYQVVLKDISIHNHDFIQFTSITDVFKPKSVCFMLGHPHYGAMGEVTEGGVDLKSSRVKVAMRVTSEPNFDRVRQLQADTRMRYMPGNIAAQRLGISSHLLSRITGTVFVINGEGVDPAHASKYNLGLNLKFNKKNEEVPGYTKKDINGTWLYSVKAVDFVKSYIQKFPELFERLEMNLVSSDMFLREHLFPNTGAEGVDATVSWLKEQQKARGTTTRTCGTEELETEVVQAIEKDVDASLEAQRQAGKSVLMQVKPHLLYKPGLNSGSVPPDPKAQHRFFDRIVCVRDSFTVPLGYKGTIIGVQKNENPLLTMYEVLFDIAFAGGLVMHGCSSNRSYRLAATDFINISYGLQIENKNSKVNIATSNWRQQQSQQNASSRGPDSWRQSQPQQHQSPHPPDPTILNSFYPAFTKNGQSNNKRQQGSQQQKQQGQGRHQSGNKAGFNDSPSHGRKQNLDQQSQFPQPPILLQRSQEPGKKTLPPIQNIQPQQHQHPKGQGPSEFQALWNELHKIQKPMDSPKRQAPAPAPEKEKPSPAMNAVTESQSWKNQAWPQDPSAFLKAMLKISDENTQCQIPSSSTAAPPANKPLAFPQMPKTTETPALVQQLFDHARQTEMKSGKSIWYCAQLLSYFQLLGTGFPRYAYHKNKDNLVCAQVTLPDMRVFCGEFCRTESEAAENTAKKVYEELKLSKMPPAVSNARPNPLRPPPQQWFDNRMNNVRPPMPPQPNVKPMLPAAFPQVPMMQLPMPKWNPMVQQNPGFANMMHPGQPHPIQQQQLQQPPQHNRPQQQQHHQQGRFPQPQLVDNAHSRSNRQDQQKKVTPFVPLQAQKKTRNVVNKQPSNEDNKQQKQQQQQHDKKEKKEVYENKVDQKPKENSAEDVKQENVCSNNKTSENTVQNNQGQNAQKGQRSVKQRRSRVAAKFQSDPMANGGDRQ